jgi:2-keto-4-pentenoate hydratase/2-oxohepta-3-ene-1,7-dioic acid hydratase in catechol pathway
MQLASFAGNRTGVVIKDEILDVVAAASIIDAFAVLPKTVLGILQAGPTALAKLSEAVDGIRREHALQARLRSAGALIQMGAAELTAPLPDPPLILAAGMNYTDHLAEMKTPRPAYPYAFVKAGSAVVGSEQDIELPPDHTAMVDWEAELALVIGKPCHRVSVSDALDYIAGYMAANDVSARDWADAVMTPDAPLEPLEVVSRWGVNLLGKQYPTFCPLGPVLVTSDEIADPNTLDIACRVNGETMQHNNTANMLFSPAELISYFSQFHRLGPGDVLLTGTMGGVGIGRSPRVFLKPGDIVEVEISGVGLLRNRVSGPTAP